MIKEFQYFIMNEINSLLTLLECTLINEESPDYIEVSEQNGFIYILLSKRDYKNMSISERINGIFNLLRFEHLDILQKYVIIVECLDSQELTGLFKMYSFSEKK